MYVVFYGTDRERIRDAATEYIDARRVSDGRLTIIDATDFVSGQLHEALGATSLFGGSEYYILDTPSGNSEFQTELHEALSELAASANTFVVLEGPLLAAAKKKLGQHAAEIAEYSTKPQTRYNLFSLAEALAAKNKRQLWVLLQTARQHGLRAEEIIGILWWQLKSLRLAAATTSAAEAGMKEFPYNKARRALGAFAPGEVERIAQALLEVYHDGHAGLRDMDIALEEWVLSL